MRNRKRLLAMILIFTLTFSNFAFVTESVAATTFVSLFGNSADKDNKNVEFEAYFENGNETSNAIVSDVNNENLAIKLQVDVKESGYLKNAKVEMKAQDEEELNFAIKPDDQMAEQSNIQSLENNVLKLNKMDSSSEKMEMSIPIEYHMEDYIKEGKLCQTAKAVLSGTYVDEKGKEHEISKEVELTLTWKDERAVRVESEIAKYIQFGNGGVILQNIIKVDSTQENKNSLPVQATEVNIEVPSINNKKPSEVTVVANSTAGTNGKEIGEVEFSNENWNYEQEANRVTIKVENKKELVDANPNVEYLKAENEETKQEERYYSVAGIDEYVVTYTFQNVELTDEMKIESKVEAKLTTLSEAQTENMSNETIAEKEAEFLLTGQTGNIVSYNVENETKEVSKVYSYLENHETEYDTKTVINVSYKDIVEEMIIEDVQNYYLDKSENKVEVDDLYYKQISINQENFKEILGEEGYIQILDASGNELTTINKDMQVDENGNYTIQFQDRISKIQIKTSAPVNTGNLIVSNQKAVTNISINKADYANMEYMATDTIQKAKFDYVTDLVSLGNCTTKTKLKDTKTNFNLNIDRDSLSTVTENSNVEMRLELNNDEENSDIYGNSIFEIEMPEYVTGLTVTNASMIYGEGLNISSVEAYSKEGRPTIKIAVDGKQTNLNSGVLTNGTNIVLNADITVDKYTPATDATFKAYCYNSEATNYENPAENVMNDVAVCDYKEAKVEYSAPSGVVAVNTISNYNEAGDTVTSIKQGKQVGYIDIYAPAKEVTMEMAIMNNTDKAIANLNILGRIPFKGVKDLETGDDLGTTLDTKWINGIIANENNKGDFSVYYSEKEDANNDLTDTSNGWVKNPENLADMKSYLIVPNDENYQMEVAEVLKFSYVCQIPENLDHNEAIYGTFMAYYTNNTEDGLVKETAKPDLVGLTTGVGPELELSIKTDAKEVKALEEFETTISIKNTGEDVVNDVLVNIPVPKNTSFVSAETSRSTANAQLADNNVVVNIGRLEKDMTIDINIKFKVDNVAKNTTSKIVISATATAKDLQKELTAKADEISIRGSELALEQSLDYQFKTEYFKKDRALGISLSAMNLTDSDIENVSVVAQLPKEIKFVRGYMTEGSVWDGYREIENATFDEATNKVTWKISKIEARNGKALRLQIQIGDMEAGLTEDSVRIASQILADNTETYNAEDLMINLTKNSLSITQNSSTPTYVDENNSIDYVFSIYNRSNTMASNVILTDIVPDGLTITRIAYTADGREHVSNMSEKESARLNVRVPAGGQVDVNVQAIASSLDGMKEKTVTNTGTISADNMEDITSNSVTHIIRTTRVDGSASGDDDENYDNSTSNGTFNNDITRSYRISGTAWLDANKNGVRDNDEKKMENITAMLVDSNSGVIKETQSTNQNGEYSFGGVQNGSYLVIFKYDTALYTTTTYRKEGVDANVNSDAVATQIEQGGNKENAAVTDRIDVNGANVTNIDLGLTEAEKFSLQLDKAITKVTVQNAQGTKTEKFDKTKLAQYGISAKHLAGTTVYIEYTITTKNNGDIAGFASEIVDYLPEGMTFNSKLNPDWYTGSDGNLYTKALANSELAKGESKEIKLVLTKQMTEENTGMVSNTAEIASDFNVNSISDYNSKAGNKAQGEDDMSTADIILTVKTGETLIYLTAILLGILLGGAVAYVVYKRVLKKKRGGA